jgi:endonuclease-3
MAPPSASRLRRIVDALREEYGTPRRPPTKTAFEYYLWDRVGYLFNDDKRREAFEALRKRVGLTPRKIAAATQDSLTSIAAMGGIEASKRAAHMRDAAEMVMGDFDNDLDAIAAGTSARKQLKKLPMTADAGADRIMMFARKQRVLGLESNGLRVLQRIGYGESSKDFARSYRSVSAAIAPELSDDADWLIDAHLLLRRHGQEVCKSSGPDCGVCCVRRLCDIGLGSSR